MPFAEELELHIRAGYPILYVPTFEEIRAEETIAEAAAGLSKPRKVQIWDIVNGFPNFTRSRGSPTAALEYIDAADESEPAIFVLRDFHRFLDNVQVARWLRELARTLKRKPHTVILLAPTLELPPDLAEDVSVLDMRPPTYEQIDEEINRLLKNQSVRLEVGGREALVKACQGLMMNRIQLVISKALAQHARIDHRAIHLALEEKKQRIRQTEVLEFYPVAETLDDVGGMDVLKMWLNRRATAFTEEARAYGLPNPKGVMLVGIQGTGKSLVAKTIANLWQLPLLRMDVGRLMGALVGQSEQRTREAIQIAEAMAPCVLWIDEIDKAFAGSASGSPVGDSGTSARVFGTVVTWMQEKTTPVFVTATANAIENLPPELLRKGRFDEIFFIGLPSEQEREEIFYVHLRRVREMRLREFDIRRLAAASDGYSGAEIEQAIIEAMHAAFEARREFTTEDIVHALETIVPLGRTMEEEIERLQQWAESGRVRFASSDAAEEALDLPTRRDQTLRAQITGAGMPREVEIEARRELERMATLSRIDPERNHIRNYLDWLVALPWQGGVNGTDPADLDMDGVRAVLDSDHYGLESIKERILEYLATRKLRAERAETLGALGNRDAIRREREGVILCFLGPPGVGKTSLGASIARAMGREFARMSLGGVHDEAEIRGHRRTYIGAQPGRIMQTIRRAGTRNPVIMLDEIDKLGADFRGDPSAALLEVLDPEQNHSFRDHFLEVPFDLSQVLFIATANERDPIPRALRDRMETIRLSSYTEREKVHIAEGYLIPRQLRENGLLPGEIAFGREALLFIIRRFTLEAGVRELERRIGEICRKIATRFAENGQQSTPITIDADAAREHLGEGHRFLTDIEERTRLPGVAIGLAMTPGGGDIMFIEATMMPGHKGFRVTGRVQEVAQESALAALSYIRARAGAFGIPAEAFDKHDIHIHLPDGATPKDGPSAGVGIAIALISMLTGRPVLPNVAVTGELTLRGRVLSVGGIKEKILAAHRVGLDTVILPRSDEHALDDLPEEVKRDMTFALVDEVDAALKIALGEIEV